MGGDRKSDQDLESGHVVLMSKTEQSPLFISMQTGLIKRIGLSTAYTIARHMQQSSSKSVPALCFGVLFNQTHGMSMGQERITPWQRYKPLAKNALPAAVVPWCDHAKGNREERGGHHAAIWTDVSVKHTEEIKVMHAPFKCASMLGHRRRVVL